MLVDQIHFQLRHLGPQVVEILTLRVRARRTYYLYLWIPGAYCLHERFKTLHIFRTPLLIAYGEIFEVERLRMSHFRSEGTPLGGYVAIGELHEVEGIIYIWLKAVDRDMGTGIIVLILTGQTYAQHGKRLGPNLLAQYEILIEAETVALVIVRIETVGEGIVPAVLVNRPVLNRADSVFPLVTSLQVSTLHDTASGETEHSGMDVGEFLRKVFSQAVLMAVVGIGGEERYMLQVDDILRLEEHYAEAPLLEGFARLELYRIFLPVFSGNLDFL